MLFNPSLSSSKPKIDSNSSYIEDLSLIGLFKSSFRILSSLIKLILFPRLEIEAIPEIKIRKKINKIIKEVRLPSNAAKKDRVKFMF